jgi:S-methylmethionine-dependent homocysteine/selenocysteine methylase
VSGAIGPRGDGYDPGKVMRPGEAAAYHAFQIRQFRNAGADLVSGFTITNSNEAEGVVLAAKAEGIPCVISFTVETDGRLPNGESLAEAIGKVDAATDEGPAYYMINCAHPTHFDHVLDQDGAWIARFAPTRRAAAMLSSTTRRNSTSAIRTSSAANTPICFAAFRISMCLAAAAGRITAMCSASARPAAAVA